MQNDLHFHSFHLNKWGYRCLDYNDQPIEPFLVTLNYWIAVDWSGETIDSFPEIQMGEIWAQILILK